MLFYFPSQAAAEDRINQLNSETAVLMDGETGQILFEKEADKRMYPASITKIASAIMTLETGNLEDETTISRETTEVEGTSVYLVEGETLSIDQLVKGMLINSGNDAGSAIAEHYSGSDEKFAGEMTAYLKDKTGIEDTSFKNPHGLHDPEHYTTASDMAEITRYAMENEEFRELSATEKFDWNSKGWETTIVNHHRLLFSNENVTGGKNGFVKAAGNTLVTTAEKDGRELIAVVLKAENSASADADTTALLNEGFTAYEEREIEEGVMESEDGIEYDIPNLVYLAGKDALVEVTVEEGGYLTVTDEENNELFVQKVEALPGQEQPEEENTVAAEAAGETFVDFFLERRGETSPTFAEVIPEMLQYQFNYFTP
ncbi:D-alanyl-D-alanine carboxypeptidase family protein [Sinobaca qinghaiensis]|uniref:D-alanyl-D-alanine carboxypeptidase family protein n=1 Tax=Sinobaca qinghaiensis TaxID=342944 RepID=UPI0014766C02|nr:D-alanyl-D-alanine carboxypeptidase family protein [Sinobaca qinghaiensis]